MMEVVVVIGLVVVAVDGSNVWLRGRGEDDDQEPPCCG